MIRDSLIRKKEIHLKMAKRKLSEKTEAAMEELRKLVGELASQRKLKQAIVAVESGDRSFRWAGAEGESDSEGGRISEDTPFFIASIDKLYNAVVAMTLNEAGRLNLDEAIAAYLPAAVVRGLHRIGGTDHSERITVRHLLTHTSGLPDWIEDRPRGGASLVETVLKEGDRAVAFEEFIEIVRGRLQPHFPPQDLSARRPKIRYSDSNYMLVAAIIEAVTGTSLERVHEERLYQPLGMRHTYFPGLSRPLEPAPAPMVLRIKGEPLSIPLLIKSFKGIYSTAADNITLLRGLVRGEVFQNPETYTLMGSRWLRFGFPTDRAALRSPVWPIEYGIGIMRFRPPRVFTPSAAVPAVVGHSGSTGCWLFHCPELDLLLCGSVDEVTAGPVPYRFVPRILRLLGRAK